MQQINTGQTRATAFSSTYWQIIWTWQEKSVVEGKGEVLKFGRIVLGFVFLTRCHVVVTTYCSKQQEEVLLRRAGESHICSRPLWLTHHCVLQAGLSACSLKPWHKEDGCRSTCVCAGGYGSLPHWLHQIIFIEVIRIHGSWVGSVLQTLCWQPGQKGLFSLLV